MHQDAFYIFNATLKMCLWILWPSPVHTRRYSFMLHLGNIFRQWKFENANNGLECEPKCTYECTLCAVEIINSFQLFNLATTEAQQLSFYATFWLACLLLPNIAIQLRFAVHRVLGVQTIQFTATKFSNKMNSEGKTFDKHWNVLKF